MNRTHSARFTNRPLVHSLRPRAITKASPAITARGAADVVSMPNLAVGNMPRRDQRMRVFAERLNYALPMAITINAAGAPSMVIPQGTKVNIYDVQADKAGDLAGGVKQLVGSVKFNTTILAVLTNGTQLINPQGRPHANITAAYSASGAMGDGYTISVYPQQNRVDVTFDIWNVVEQMRIITLAQ